MWLSTDPGMCAKKCLPPVWSGFADVLVVTCEGGCGVAVGRAV